MSFAGSLRGREANARGGSRRPSLNRKCHRYFSTKMLCFSPPAPMPTSPADYLVQAFDDEAEFLRRDPSHPGAQPLGRERAHLTDLHP